MVAVPAWSEPQAAYFTLNDGSGWGDQAFVTDSAGKTLPASTSGSVGGNGAIPIRFVEGNRIVGFTVQALGNGVTDVNYGLTSFTPTGGISALGSATSDINRAHTWGAFTVPVTPTVLTADMTVYLRVITSASGYSISSVIPRFDHL